MDETLDVEAKSHIEMFHHLFFTLAPDDKYIKYTMDKAMYLVEALELTNAYAPEHLIIETENYMEVAERVTNAGSVFLGSLTPESAGDYASGTNPVSYTHLDVYKRQDTICK